MLRPAKTETQFGNQNAKGRGKSQGLRAWRGERSNKGKEVRAWQERQEEGDKGLAGETGAKKEARGNGKALRGKSKATTRIGGSRD